MEGALHVTRRPNTVINQKESTNLSIFYSRIVPLVADRDPFTNIDQL